MRSEFEFIESLRNNFNFSAIGDDCAVLPKNSTHDLLITADMLVEDIDFRLEWAPPKFIGHKALAVSLSDIAAMGGKPTHSLISIGIPDYLWKSDFADEFYEGYTKLAKKFEVELVGGDISKTPEKVVIDSVILGETPKGQAVLRSTAKPGDFIVLTGVLGGAHAGLELLESGTHLGETARNWQKNLLLQQLVPIPQSGDIYSEIATSMIDVSDGLSSDLAHICKASKVGAKIYADKIPVDENIDSLSRPKTSELDLALNGGEDFELLFTVNSKNILHEILADCFEIGEITAMPKNIELIRDGDSEILTPKGFSHF